MPKKKPTKQELGIPTFKQSSNLESIKSLARISQAHRVLRAAGLDEHSKHDKQTQTEQEDHIEAEIVDNLDIAEVILHEAAPQQGNAPEYRHSWVITGILLALWIRLLL
jgi:hypothetical protein